MRIFFKNTCVHDVRGVLYCQKKVRVASIPTNFLFAILLMHRIVYDMTLASAPERRG